MDICGAALDQFDKKYKFPSYTPKWKILNVSKIVANYVIFKLNTTLMVFKSFLAQCIWQQKKLTTSVVCSIEHFVEAFGTFVNIT